MAQSVDEKEFHRMKSIWFISCFDQTIISALNIDDKRKSSTQYRMPYQLLWYGRFDGDDIVFGVHLLGEREKSVTKSNGKLLLYL